MDPLIKLLGVCSVQLLELRLYVVNAGACTCFKAVTSLKLEDALPRDKSSLPESFGEGRYCEDYDFRCEASARTWSRPHAQDNLMYVLTLRIMACIVDFPLDHAS